MKNIEVCSLEECQSSGKKVVVVDGLEILLVYTDGAYFAVDNLCPHAQTRLVSGRVEEGTLTCSNHGTCFDLTTGAVRIDKIDEDLLKQLDVDNLPFGPLKTYPLQIVDGMIVITV
ncbi:Rieske (2Fe-2S) protein [Mangrovibacterium sp.]|uniref:Rieske (2Fe-2S) protein n=1 Tax=Mangrovibacterium sp. TaxID=1961364 RepID=UPI0035678606